MLSTNNSPTLLLLCTGNTKCNDCHRTYHTMEVETIVKSRIGKFDKATASNWHLLGIQLNQIIEYYKIKQ